MKNFNVNDQGFYGRFGGAYVPEILHANVEKLRECYLREMEDESFQQEFRLLLRDYVGRPSPLYYARRLSEKYGTRIYLKREDLNRIVDLVGSGMIQILALEINPEPTRSTIRSVRFYWPGVWERRGSLPKPEPGGTE